MKSGSGGTVVVELTPPGRAAVAVVLVAGPGAVGAVGDCFRPASGRPLADVRLGRIAFGRWGGPDGEELIVCRRAEDQIEIHCHGGVAAVGAIIERLAERGCRRVSWQDWLRTPVPGASRRDATTWAAKIALAEAPTARTAAVLLDQYHGALSRTIQSAIAAIESRDWSDAAEIIDGVLRYRDVGLHLSRPWRVVVAGAPNVGKSSLINALAGYTRAIVSPQPGTTRDVVTTTTAIAGWPVQLADTAGLRDTSDALESAGVALAADALMGADLIIVVHDVSRGGTRPVGDGSDLTGILARLPPQVRVIHVGNKMDLLPAASRQELDGEAAIATSAITGEGVAALLAAIARALVPRNPDAGEAVPFTAEQVAGLETAQAAIARQDASIAGSELNALLLVDDAVIRPQSC
jgi:tRNA modification GTPase